MCLIRKRATTIHRYPAQSYEQCRLAVAKFLGRHPSQLLLTAGVDEALDLFYSLGRSVLLFYPGFRAFKDRAHVCGVSVVSRRLTLGWGLPKIESKGQLADLAVIASPHNPSGRIYPSEQLFRLQRYARYVFCDETYIDFSNAPSLLAAKLPNAILVFRSFSKAFGLAGLRVGCLVGAQKLIKQMEARKAFCTVDTIALAGVMGALQDIRYLRRCVGSIVRERDWLYGQLARIPTLKTWTSAANFLLVTTSSQDRMRDITRALEKERISVRDCSGFGLPSYFRLSIGTRANNQRVLGVLRRAMGHE